MPVNKKYIHDFEEGQYLHMICKAVGNTSLFPKESNRYFFLRQYAKYSHAYLHTYAYILMPNHVHWIVKCTDRASLLKHLKELPGTELKSHQRKLLRGEISLSETVEYQCKDFFISYAMAYNKMFGRSGSLFINPFRRVVVKD